VSRPLNDESESLLDVLFVTSNYPFEGHANVGTFVATLAEAWARQGDSIGVIAPLPLWSAQTREFIWRHPTWRGDGKPTVHRPSFMSYSNRRIGPISTQALTVSSFRRAVLRAARSGQRSPDIVYSHFLFPAGEAAVAVASEFRKPCVVALGESGFEQAEAMRSRDEISRTLRSFSGVLSVSEENARIVTTDYGVDPDRIQVVPNAVDTDRFRPHDRREARERLGLPQDAMILSFTGYFIERKGPLRVLEAMMRVPGLYGLFLGDGPQQPTGDRVLHSGRVAHDEVALWLSASDFFVLPTLAEGSPNAVIEAMACGLPVISSNIPSLRETVTGDAAMLVDPMDIDALASQMRVLAKDADRRDAMSTAALERGRRTNIDDRARTIRQWLRTLTLS
jgi:teichuronic acid biosynthesis glycosyltransferase TuaC